MPRKNPMPAREVAVCKRVRAIREALVWSQPELARALHLDISYLQNIENARTPLRWGLAEKLFEVLGVNLDWLANGRGEAAIPVDWAPLFGLDVSDRDLFTQVYDQHVASLIIPKLKSLGLYKTRPALIADAHWRMLRLDQIANFLFDELAQIPDSKADKFCDEVMIFAQRLGKKMADKDSRAINKRRAEMDALAEQFAARRLYYEKLHKQDI